MRASGNEIIKILFLNPLSKTGNLTVAYNDQMPVKRTESKRSKWGAALVAEKQKAKVLLMQIIKIKIKLVIISLKILVQTEIKYTFPWTILTSS